MFDLPVLQQSLKAREGAGQLPGEAVATFGQVKTILGALRFWPETVPYAAVLWITAGCWFTSPTAFASPAVTIARTLTDSFAGVRPADAPGFICAQLIAGALAAFIALRLFEPEGRGYRRADAGTPPEISRAG